MMRPQLPDHPFTTAQATDVGLTPKQLRHAVAQGEARRVFTGVYVAERVPDSIQVRAAAARLVMSPHSVLCDRTAAWIHGIDVWRCAELDVLPALETYVLRGHDPTDRRDCHGGTRDLVPTDWMLVSGARVTTPLRTALDLACKLPRRDAMAALDAFARDHGVTQVDLRRLLVRYHRRRGVVQARELVGRIEPLCESFRESWVHLEIHDRGLPPPVAQHWVYVGGVPTYRLDFAYPHARVAVEYDGEEHHSSAEQRSRDGARRAWLREHGWRVVVLRRESFATDEAVDAWIGELAGHLGR